jgi:hypothetical protein
LSIVSSNKFLFWAGVVLIWAGVIVGTLWIKGYQPQSSRSFTDDEMIRIAVQRAMQRTLTNPRKVVRVQSEDGSKNEFFRPAFIVPYRDVEHFLEENPDCCKFGKKYGAKYVDVSGKIMYRDKSGKIHHSKAEALDRQYFPNNIRYLP